MYRRGEGKHLVFSLDSGETWASPSFHSSTTSGQPQVYVGGYRPQTLQTVGTLQRGTPLSFSYKLSALGGRIGPSGRGQTSSFLIPNSIPAHTTLHAVAVSHHRGVDDLPGASTDVLVFEVLP